MAELTFNAAQFDSQATPDALPTLPGAPTPQPSTTSLLTEDQAFSLGKHSDWLGLLDTEEKVLQHYAILADQRKAKHVEEAETLAKSPVERARLAQVRAEHSNVVNAANLVWREAVAKRKAMLFQLDAEVEAARLAYKRAKDGV